MFIWVSVTDASQYYGEGISHQKCAAVERAAGERGVVIPYEELTLREVMVLRPTAVLYSGFGGTFSSYAIAAFRGMWEVLTKAPVPQLAICGSCQMLPYFFAPDFLSRPSLCDTPIRRLGTEDIAQPRYARRYGDTDLSPYYIADGYFPITPVKAHPLFARLERPAIMRCQHYCEIKTLPPHFVRLAESAHSPIEALAHETRPVFGVQFHPECYTSPFWDGYILLQNFFALARRQGNG